MTFSEAITHLKNGKKIRLPGWDKDDFIWLKNDFLRDSDDCPYTLSAGHLSHDDWELIEEPKQIKEKIMWTPISSIGTTRYTVCYDCYGSFEEAMAHNNKTIGAFSIEVQCYE